MLSERLLQLAYNLQHLLFVLFREILLDIHLADGFSENAVRNAHGTFPTRLLLCDAAHGRAEEIKVCSIEVI